MDEHAARQVAMLRAIETGDPARTVFNDEDRAWATRAAAEVEGAAAAGEAFVARRASLALERLTTRFPSIGRTLRAVRWRERIAPLAVFGAFTLGLASDQIGDSKKISILAFPLLMLIVWNLAVYVLIAVRAIRGLVRRAPVLGPMRQLVGRFGHGIVSAPAFERDATLSRALGHFLVDWTKLSTPLLSVRIGRILHLSAFAFAIGAIASMYVRGVVLEYRAGWESTFLDATQVRAMLSVVLGPASTLTGIPLPNVAGIEAIRFSGGQAENAARWLHLYAVTVGLIVLLPRFVLFLVTLIVERHRESSFPLPRDDPYFGRLVRQLRGEAMTLRVVPYAAELSPRGADGLRALLERIYGAKAVIDFAPVVTWGEEDSYSEQPSGAAMALVFGLVATPEPEHHGVFVRAVRKTLGPDSVLVTIVDESAFQRRFAQSPERIQERRSAWRQMLAAEGIEPVFVDLDQPDLLRAEVALNAAIESSSMKASA